MGISKFVRNPLLIFGSLGYRGFFNWIPDKQYLEILYWISTGKRLNLKNPRTFNEKIQWQKLYDRKPEYTMMVDKYEVKRWMAEKIGEEYIVPTLGVWNCFDEIDFDSLPEQFVLKCTHNSGGTVIVKEKRNFNKKAAKKQLEKCMRRNYYWLCREWPYKNVKPRIIAEKYLKDGEHIVPEDYKVYCINGCPKYIVVFHNRFNDKKGLSETVYDVAWNPQNISLDNHFAISDIIEPKPECLEELLNICTKLCKGYPQLRLDFYILDNKIYFGEVTFHTASGFQPMIPLEMDLLLGKQITLPDIQS